jgi:hypothetical protein
MKLRRIISGFRNESLAVVLPILLIAVMAMGVILSACAAPGAGSSAASAAPAVQPKFQVIGFGVNPQEAGPGEEVQVLASVVNTGNGSGTYLAELKVNGVTDQTREITLGPGTVQDLKFRVTREPVQAYQVNLGEMSGRFLINAQKVGAAYAATSASGSASCCSTSGPSTAASAAGSSCCSTPAAGTQATPVAPSSSALRAPAVKASCCQ